MVDMSKCKELVKGACLVVIASFLWLVSSCSQPVDNPVPIETPNADNSTSAKIFTTTTQALVMSKPTPAQSSITTESPTTGNSTPAESPTTTPESSSVYNIDINKYRIDINGLVSTPLSLSYEQIQSYPTVVENVELVCPGVEDQTEEWTGVLVSTLLAKAHLTPGAGEVVFSGVDGYSIQLPLEFIQQSQAFLAYLVDGQTLPQWRGYPLRLVLSGNQGSGWVEWITNIEIKPASASFTNQSVMIQNSRGNMTISGRKLCSCPFLSIRGSI
jgi:DMSO/TMAO reductase YedYZ molybdopterin-dependent catalytic subunit